MDRTSIDRTRQLARARAYRRLAAKYARDFDRLHDEERRKVGLPNVQRAERQQERIAS